MLPGMGGINPKKMQSMLNKMGIKQEEVEANRVILEREDGNIVIENPQVMKVVMQGQETWQIVGDVKEESDMDKISEEDVSLVAEKTGKSHEEAKNALDSADGDIAAAIMKLSE